MLDSDTKRRIDTARDILVGKVPDPKSQVEQITIALIYKFMDDMDAQAEELGGKRKFFAKDFARYGWAKLMGPSVGGHELIGLYGEGIAKMPENPGIPTLFRDIFRNTYLPYRDPETLKAFLKIINEFEYDHSERLGDAFEYLLSVLGSQGDAGQFRTPRHIIDFMVKLVDPKKSDTILDPACGTAGFLISAWKHINNANSKEKAAALTPDERKKLAAGIVGYDISPDMVRLSRANMYLHGFADPHIHEYDTLTSQERWNETFDVILANPPFMTPKGGIKPHSRFGVQSKRSEVLFVDYIAEHLTPNGRAGIVVPEGIIERADTAYQKLRDLLIREYIVGVVSLPAGLFLPYTKVKTSILILDKAIARQGAPVLFSQVKRVGISLDAARTSESSNDLPTVVADYDAMRRGDPVSPISWYVDREKLRSRGKTLAGLFFRQRVSKGKYPMVRLGDLCTITRGESSSTKTEPGEYPLVVRGEERLTSNAFQIDGEAVCVPLLSLAHGVGQIKRVHYAKGKFAVANLMAAVVPKDDKVLNALYLFITLDRAKNELAQLMQGSVFVTLKLDDLEDFEVPLPPMEVQAALADKYKRAQELVALNQAIIRDMQTELAGELSAIRGE